MAKYSRREAYGWQDEPDPLIFVPGPRAAGTKTKTTKTRTSRLSYPWLTLRLSGAQWVATWVAVLTGVGLAYLYIMYQQSNDASPDSIYGYGFAIGGTALLLLVGLGYVLRKRVGRRKPGRLHALLAWHMAGGLLGLVLILMHADGNFNPRTGTYALYGLIGVVVSGVIGRVLDRLSPRMAARVALQALSASGEERLDDLEEELAAIAQDAQTRRERLQEQGARGAPWDLAYYDLDPEVEDIPRLLHRGLRGETGPILNLKQLSGPLAVPRSQQAFAPRRQSTDALARQAIDIQRVMGREQFYLQLVRVWRKLHMLISLAALGLLIWHLEFAATLLLNAK